MNNKVFKILKPEIRGNEVLFKYEILNFKFEERHVFPFDLKNVKSIFDLAIATSVSYYKLHLADEIYIDWNLNEKEIEFWQYIFNDGFSELMYQSKISWTSRGQVKIFCSTDHVNVTLSDRGNDYKELAILGIGGGKDSSLGKMLLDEAKVEVLGYSTEIRKSEIIERNSQAFGINLFQIERYIDEQLKSKIPNTYNGHIPISLIYALTGVVVAEHKDAKYVVVANEASADEENIIWENRKINHQWSKTFEFELKLNKHILENVNPQINYFSILRNLPSVLIGQKFAEKCNAVFGNFSSCNNNFKLNKLNNGDWCGTCAKCIGTYILLKPFLSEIEMQKIFEENFLQNPENKSMFKSLLGLSVEKPFDCVATKNEMCYCVSKFLDGGLDLSQEEVDFVKRNAVLGEDYINSNFPHNIPEAIYKMI